MFSTIINRIREALNRSNPKQGEHVCVGKDKCPYESKKEHRCMAPGNCPLDHAAANNETVAHAHNDANMPWEGYEPAHCDK